MRRQGFGQPNPTCLKILVDNTPARCSPAAPTTRRTPPVPGGIGNTGYDWANEYNMIQKYAIQNSRLHIPVIFGVDAVHGFGHPWQAPLFPQSIGMGATWDPIGHEAGGAATGERAAGHRLGVGLRTGAGPLPRQPVGPHVRDLGRGTGSVRGHGRRQRRGLQSAGSGRLARM